MSQPDSKSFVPSRELIEMICKPDRSLFGRIRKLIVGRGRVFRMDMTSTYLPDPLKPISIERAQEGFSIHFMGILGLSALLSRRDKISSVAIARAQGLDPEFASSLGAEIDIKNLAKQSQICQRLHGEIFHWLWINGGTRQWSWGSISCTPDGGISLVPSARSPYST